MQREKSKQKVRARDSRIEVAWKEKRKSSSSVAQAWFETLSEAIQDDDVPLPHLTTRRRMPRRNAFALHVVDGKDAARFGDEIAMRQTTHICKISS